MPSHKRGWETRSWRRSSHYAESIAAHFAPRDTYQFDQPVHPKRPCQPTDHETTMIGRQQRPHLHLARSAFPNFGHGQLEDPRLTASLNRAHGICLPPAILLPATLPPLRTGTPKTPLSEVAPENKTRIPSRENPTRISNEPQHKLGQSLKCRSASALGPGMNNPWLMDSHRNHQFVGPCISSKPFRSRAWDFHGSAARPTTVLMRYNSPCVVDSKIPSCWGAG